MVLAVKDQERSEACPESAVPFLQAELNAVDEGVAGADSTRPKMLKRLCFDEPEKLRAQLNRALREYRVPSA